MDNDELIVLTLKQKSDFIQTPAVQSLTDRAIAYLSAGYPVHFSGPAGTGKTTLAMHVAAQLSRPVLLIHGDDEFGTSDLVGGQLGFRSSRVVDNFIHSVVKTEENFTKTWVDHRLTSACKYGFTVIYDEFNRSRPEANNVLLSILEERLLELPVSRMNEGYLAVHHNFAMIFTSNPEEYAGVHKTQDALMDRMITISRRPLRPRDRDRHHQGQVRDRSPLGRHHRRYRARVPSPRNSEPSPHGSRVHQPGQDRRPPRREPGARRRGVSRDLPRRIEDRHDQDHT